MGLLPPVIAFFVIGVCCWLFICYGVLKKRTTRTVNFLVGSLSCWLLVAYVLFAQSGVVSVLLGALAIGGAGYWSWQDIRVRVGSIRINDAMTVWSLAVGATVVLRLIMGDST
jgi:hypothetical protein